MSKRYRHRQRLHYSNNFGGSAVAAPFVPTDISGLKLWLKSDAGITTSGSTITGITDQSTLGYVATFPAAGRRPTLALAQRNGLPGIRFVNTGGSETAFYFPSFALSTSFTLFLVAEDLSVGGPVRPGWIEHGPEVDYSDGFMIDSASSGDTNVMGVRRTTNAMPQFAGGNPWGGPRAAYGTFQYKASTQAFLVRMNGSALTLGAPSPGAGTSTESVVTAALNFGCRNAANEASTPTVSQYSAPWTNAYIYEVLIYEGALSAPNITAVEAYIVSRWGF